MFAVYLLRKAMKREGAIEEKVGMNSIAMQQVRWSRKEVDWSENAEFLDLCMRSKESLSPPQPEVGEMLLDRSLHRSRYSCARTPSESNSDP